jgi:uncharacterized membrane protein YeaQ/YmgE (transglycosylase-associated protein family)
MGYWKDHARSGYGAFVDILIGIAGAILGD